MKERRKRRTFVLQMSANVIPNDLLKINVSLSEKKKGILINTSSTDNFIGKRFKFHAFIQHVKYMRIQIPV
jgi:hypothetical protein